LNLKRFAFEKLSSNSFKSQRWRALMITASGNSHHWRLLNSPACSKDHRWGLSYVTRQWWSITGGCLMWPASGDSIYIYTRRALENFLSLGRNDTTPSGCQISPPSAAVVPDRRRPSDHPAVLQEGPTDLHGRSAVVREGPALSPLGPPPSSARAPPLLPWTAAVPSSAVPRRPTTSFPSATAPLPYQDDVLLPAGRFPNRRPVTAADYSAAADSAASADSSAAPARHRHLISSPFATHGGQGWGRRRSNDSPGLVGFFLFFQNAITCVKNVDKLIVDKCNYMDCG
jgi:hypothetical protein